MKKYINHEHQSLEEEEMHCPNCNVIVVWDKGYICPFKYCPECGEALPQKEEE